MRINIILYCILIVGSVLLGCQPIDRKRVFAGWAKIVLVLVGAIGVANGIALIAWDLGWFSIGGESGQRLWAWLTFSGGVAVGLILALFLSRGMFGQTKTNPPAQTPETTSVTRAPEGG